MKLLPYRSSNTIRWAEKHIFPCHEHFETAVVQSQKAKGMIHYELETIITDRRTPLGLIAQQ